MQCQHFGVCGGCTLPGVPYAEQLAKKNDMLLRYTRMVLTHPLRKQLDEGLQYFLAMEALSTLDKSQQQ